MWSRTNLTECFMNLKFLKIFSITTISPHVIGMCFEIFSFYRVLSVNSWTNVWQVTELTNNFNEVSLVWKETYTVLFNQVSDLCKGRQAGLRRVKWRMDTVEQSGRARSVLFSPKCHPNTFCTWFFHMYTSFMSIPPKQCYANMMEQLFLKSKP